MEKLVDFIVISIIIIIVIILIIIATVIFLFLLVFNSSIFILLKPHRLNAWQVFLKDAKKTLGI